MSGLTVEQMNRAARTIGSILREWRREQLEAEITSDLFWGRD